MHRDHRPARGEGCRVPGDWVPTHPLCPACLQRGLSPLRGTTEEQFALTSNRLLDAVNKLIFPHPILGPMAEESEAYTVVDLVFSEPPKRRRV